MPSPLPSLRLKALPGYLSTPDGNSIYFWGYAAGTGSRPQLPGPVIVVGEGDTVNVELENGLPEGTSLLFPGLGPVTVQTGTGPVPAGPVYEGGRLVSLTDYAPPGGTISYTFQARSPGTYLYHSGTWVHRQVHMGLYGAIIVRPAGFDPGDSLTWTAYGPGTDTEFDREYLLVLGEIDPLYHEAVLVGRPFETSSFRPRYWTLNGRCAPDSMFPDGAGYLPSQPYGALIAAEPGEKVLLRYVGAGVENHPLHPHGNHTRLVAVDGHLLRNGTRDLSRYHFTVLVGSGQIYDQIFEWNGPAYDPVSNPIPEGLPNHRNQAIGDAGWTMWSGSPYLGRKGDIPVGVVSMNSVGEYYFMLHSHEEQQITNWGEFPGGMMTMIGVFPAGALASRPPLIQAALM